MRRFSSKIIHTVPKFLPEQTQLLINGEFVNSISGETFETIDPRTEKIVSHFSKQIKKMSIKRSYHHEKRLMRDHGPECLVMKEDVS